MKKNGKKKEEDAMSNKKFSKLAVLSILAALTLTGCSDDSEIYAKPSDYKDAIVTIDGNEEKIHNDILKIIYDAMHDGSVASKTLDAVLYRYAQSVFGSYNKIARSSSDESTTLKEAAANVIDNGEKGVVNEFIKAHKSYWTYDDEGKHINDDDPDNIVEVDDKKEWTPCNSERQRVYDKWTDIEDRIAETMYSKISSGSYTTKHFFSEAKFVRSLHQDGQDVNYSEATAVDPVDHQEQPNNPNNWVARYPSLIIPYTLEGKDVFNPIQIAGEDTEDVDADDEFMTVLHRDFYQTNYDLSEDETAGDQQFHYVEKELIEDIYNDLLVEQYLLDEEVAAVCNSRARLINAIKIEKYSTFTINADLLVKELVKEIYAYRSEEQEEGSQFINFVDEDHNPFEKIFEKYANLSKGLISYLSDAEKTLLSNINATSSDAFKLVTSDHGKEYYEHTKYGDLVEEYEELLEATDYESLDKTLYNKYTSNGTCTYEEGFDQEEITLAQTSSITKGWYVQKSAPSLDSSGTITNRLFQLSVSNAKIEAKDAEDENLDASLDEQGEIKGELAKLDRLQLNGQNWEVRESPAEKENKFLCSINGSFFLKSEGGYSEGDYKNDIVFEDDNAYYIVQVIEAAKDVKLRNAQSKNSYANTRGQSFLNDVIAQITRKVAETGNYASLAKEHWLKEMSIKYHDQNVYDYFKDNYPDLFKDEDDD